MKLLGSYEAIARPRRQLSAALLAGTALAMTATPVFAQEAEVADEGGEIVVTGIRASLQSALAEKRDAASLVEIIQAEDIGKLPDQNLAEVLENLPGIQITREAGIGTGVQIRGSNDNRTEINGVGTVGSGSGRGGIGFEDVNAAIIASVEVTKAPTAMTTEGSVGGTINLRTIRPLNLRDPLIALRVQGEYSELSKSFQPRVSASVGKKWSVGEGEFGVVLSGSYAKQDALSFRPRVDRDTLTTPGGVTATGAPGPADNYLGIQFLNQELEDFKYATYNLAGSLEYAPNENLKFFFDGFYNKQTRRQESTRIQASGVANVQRTNVPDSFETITFGSLGGVNLGTIPAALTGTLQPNVANRPNLRFSSDVGARLTESNLLRFGTEWESGRLKARIEGSRSLSSTRNPDLSTTLNFINPRTALTGTPATTPNENGTPFRYDLTGGSLAFGIDTSSATAPTTAQLLDPANIVLDAVSVGNNRTRNVETTGRMDFSLDLEELAGFLTSFDWGYRYNNTSTEFNEFSSNINLALLRDAPQGTAFSSLLVPGPSNFGRADGRSLFFGDFLIIDPARAYSDQAGVLTALQAALLAAPGARGLTDAVFNPASFYRITEKTHGIYGQLNFEAGIFSGNAGLRYVKSSINSLGNNIGAAGAITQVNTPGKYNMFLPRLNMAAKLTDAIVFRASYGQDINRPNFDNLKTSVRFGTGPNTAVVIGNPGLAPEKVVSYDASLNWYFAPASAISVGFFHKRRTNLFVTQEFAPAVDANGFKDFTAPCEGGGIFNPIADRNVFVAPANAGTGLCVPIQTTVNDPGITTQTGLEFAFQGDLSSFEDKLGFASGFGLAANLTYQKFGGGTLRNTSAADTRANAIFNASSGLNAAPYTAVQGLLDFSKYAYNVTLFYEKYGLSARARYTWRSSFRTLDTAGGATLGSTLGFPVVTAARGQLNGSITYDLTDNINIGVEGVNLTKSKISQYCVNDGALLCFQGLPDRRIQFGATIKF